MILLEEMALAHDNNDEDQEGATKATELLSSLGGQYAIEVHPDYGRCVTTTADIAKKDTILEEVPVMCAPWPLDDKVTFDEPLCLACCMHMPRKRPIDRADDNATKEYLKFGLKRCSKCSWPVCSSECENSSFHSQNECQLFVETKLPYPPPGEKMTVIGSAVLVQLIRFLLVKQRDPKLWSERVLKLQSETSLGNGRSPWNFNTVLDNIKSVFPQLEANLGSREECRKLLSIRNINAFSNTYTSDGDFSGCSICLFADASLIAHSCAPNCWWALTENTHKILIKASRDIKAGELITVCYSNQYSIYGTAKREEIFRSVGGFVCKCTRCLDPTELGTLASGILCEHCLVGYKLPEEPTEADSKWKCGMCGHKEPGRRMEGIVRALEVKLNSITTQIQPMPLLSRFLENCKSLVHNNHWIVTQTEDAIMKEWARDPAVRFRGRSPQEIAMTCEYFVSICFHVLYVRNVVSPGLSFHRARYLLLFARTRMARLEFFVSIIKNPTKYLKYISSQELASEEYRQQQFQSLREEYKEICELYDEVLEYTHLSCTTGQEVKCEIEHLVRFIAPVVKLEPHRLFAQEMANGDNPAK